MFEVLLSCARCDDQLEARVPSLEAAEKLACECGDGWIVEAIGASEPVIGARRPPRLRAVEAAESASPREPLRRAA